MNLTATTHSLELVTSTATPIAWMVDYTIIDKSGATSVTSASAQGVVSSAMDTTIVPAPSGANIAHVVTGITIRNTHASGVVGVVVQKDVSGTEYPGPGATLAAGESFVFSLDRGWDLRDSSGASKTVQARNAPIMNAINVEVMPSDVTNNNAVANTLADVTGLTFPVVAGGVYWFEFVVPYTAAAATTGSRWTLNGPAAPTMLSGTSEYTLTATTKTLNSFTAYGIPAAASASSLTAGNVATVWGMIKPSSDGDVQLQFASEVSGSAIVAKAGAVCRWMRVL